MRLKNFLNEDIVAQALDLPEPEVGDKYPPEKVNRYLEIINKALDAMKKKEENDANDAIVADLRDKKEKWGNVEKETKPVKTKTEPPPGEEEKPPEAAPPEEEPKEAEPGVGFTSKPPEEETPPEDQEELGPDQPNRKKKKKIGEAICQGCGRSYSGRDDPHTTGYDCPHCRELRTPLEKRMKEQEDPVTGKRCYSFHRNTNGKKKRKNKRLRKRLRGVNEDK